MQLDSLQAISPLDGRYAAQLRHVGQDLADCFSEFALIRARLQIEVEFLIALGDAIKVIPELDNKALQSLRAIYQQFDLTAAKEVKRIEQTTNHDVKAVEYFLQKKIAALGLNQQLIPWIHFGLTSEDTNNIAYALMIRSALDSVFSKTAVIIGSLKGLAGEHAASVMLARTHGQSASPTTFGKEMAVFAHRLLKPFDVIADFVPVAKLAGATGNYSAFQVAFPEVDWPGFASRFIEGLGLRFNPLVTQIETHDDLSELLDAMARFNTVLIGLDQDIWRYISDGWIGQKVKKGEVGSSTMPHKVNPIDFENSEGNLQLANSGLRFLSEKLLISRLQRDLSDSTVMRNLGVYFGYSLLGYESFLRGLRKIEVNAVRMQESVTAHPEVLAEPVQTILRREGISDAYEQLKKLTRGKPLSLETLQQWVEKLTVNDQVKSELLALKPEAYIGLAEKLALSSLNGKVNKRKG